METEKVYYVGIDIGSTASKTVVLDEDKVVDSFVLPTGWSGRETAGTIYEKLREKGYSSQMQCVATGYGRVCVDYANKVVTEITCHGRGGWALFHGDAIIIDVGGQDTKIMKVADGQVADFLMNDKCAAGTGKFIEVMAARLGVSLEEFYTLAETGNPLAISAMCTVFAESEVISHIGAGEKREDIASGVIHSVAARVSNLAVRFGVDSNIILTGGLCNSPYFIKVLSDRLDQPVAVHSFGRYAGALGAALIAGKKTEVKVIK